MQTDKHTKEVYDLFESRGCKIIKFIKKSDNIDYICKCGETKSKTFGDFKRRGCDSCNKKSFSEKLEEFTDDSGQIWKPIEGGWISNLGNAKNSLKKDLTLCPTKFRYHIGGKNQYATRLLAEAFQIENYEKLNDKKYGVIKINQSEPIKLDNIKIVLLSERNRPENLPRQSETFQEKFNWTQDRFRDIENVKVSELPDHTIYKNGEIWNGSRFLVFSKSENYLRLCTKDKNYKLHRLICYAFNPIEGKNNLSDYDDLQVNHKDGNTINNIADNLEWISSSENMFHSYENNLNKKVRNVLQYSLSNEFIAEYPSIAEASRKTEEPEHRIRTIAQGKTNSLSKYIWKFKNEEETEEYSRKYSKK